MTTSSSGFPMVYIIVLNGFKNLVATNIYISDLAKGDILVNISTIFKAELHLF